MKQIIKSFIVAFSIYSKIPMPRFNWDSRDMKYHLCFFPLVGGVIGGLEFFWNWLFFRYGFGSILYYCMCLSIPLLVTGGFHLDGFLDTMDAIHSYQNKEKKLEILKDPHVGAFAIISLAVYFLLALGTVFEIKTSNGIISLCSAFFLSRCLSGISVICFPKAKKDGMLAAESRGGNEKKGKIVNFTVLFVQFVAAVVLLLVYTVPYGLEGVFAVMAVVMAFVWFYFMSRRHFGGITGDLCGFFVSVSELAAVCAVAVYILIFEI